LNRVLKNIVFLPILFVACRPSGNDQAGKNEPKSTVDGGPEVRTIISEFPVFELDELVESISQEELIQVMTEGESKEWKRTGEDADKDQVVLRNKLASDNSVKFTVYKSGSRAMVGVQQQNAQVSVSEIWEYRNDVDGDHPERWNQYLFSDYKIDSFFTEKIILPEMFRGDPASSYLDYQFSPKGVTVSLNKWTFMRDLESNSIEIEGPLDPANIKYKYTLTWDGRDFVEKKITEAGYEETMTFTTNVVEPSPGGPGPHEFDCPHGVIITTSSSLKDQGTNIYSPANMLDPDEQTAWSEGVSGDGVGEWIEFKITEDFVIGRSWQLSNGYTKTKAVWEQNNRVKKFKVLVDDQIVGYVMLGNISTYQSFNIAPSWMRNTPNFKKGTRIRFVIEDVYKGSRFEDTVISYFVPTGNCG